MLADVVYNAVTVVAPIVGVIAALLLTPLVHRWRQRRKGDEDVRASVRRHGETLYGRRPTIFEKHPPPGLVDQMEEFGRVQGEHTDLLNTLIEKVTPNGGNSRESGDLLLLIAKKLDIEIPDEA